MHRGGTTETGAVPTRISGASSSSDHVVEFYERDEFLIASVVQFVLPALTGDEAAIVVATPGHRQLLAQALTTAGVPATDRDGRPRVVFLDAAETLARFTVDGRLDPQRFRSVIGSVIEEATSGRAPRARIFGEMVALLWAAGDVAGAIELEDLWNGLLDTHSFGLLCAYPASALAEEGDADAITAVCERHLAVVPSESFASMGRIDDPLRAVAILQAEAGSIANERAALRVRQHELEETIERLEELERRRSEFVAMLAHDLRSPTAILSTLLDLLRDSWPALGDDEIDDFITRALGSARQIGRLTDDILMLARLESGTFTYNAAPVDLVELAGQVVEELRSETGRTILLEVLGQVPLALADADRQRQILRNLTSNATKFSPADTPITLTIVREADHLSISVRDRGVGIAPDDLRELFRPFTRLSTSDGGAADGSGLGLAITKALVEGQAGTIEVESTHGAGSAFTYTVPVAQVPS